MTESLEYHELCWACQSKVRGRQKDREYEKMRAAEQSPEGRAEAAEISARLEAQGIYGASDGPVAKRMDKERNRGTYSIRPATAGEHKEILKVSKTSSYTRDFSNQLMFSSEAAYQKHWITVAVMKGQIIGFACVRHKSRAPETMLYFLAVLPEHRGGYIGQRLLEQIMDVGPHSTMALNVMKENVLAVKFYKRLGFRIYGSALKEQAHHMRKDWAKS